MKNTQATKTTVRFTKVTRALMRRSIRLLDMEYKPKEIAKELNSSAHYILGLVAVGAPARKDVHNRYWIHGENFAKWLSDVAPKNDADLKKRPTVSENECYCLTCGKITEFTVTKRKGRVVYGTCKKGHKVSRFISAIQATKNITED